MKKIIYIFTLSLMFVSGSYLIQIEDADARDYSRSDKRKIKRAYVAGATRDHRRGNNRNERKERKKDYRGERRERREDYRDERREYSERQERREKRQNLIRGAVAVGIGAAIAVGVNKSKERREDDYR